MTTPKADLRREAGRRTRESLVAATIELLARRGLEGVSLREVTDKAGANVAAVSYHFGSLKGLRDSAVESAMERYLDAQIEALRPLTAESTLEELAQAFARPMIHALADGGVALALIRTVARVGIDPPEGWDRLTGKFEQTRVDALRVLTPALPDLEPEELIFRIRCAAGLLNWVALAPLGVDLAAQPVAEIERQLVPVLAGALRGR